MQQTQPQQQQQQQKRHPNVSPHGMYTIAVLCYVNVINYADRYGLYAVLVYVQAHFDIEENAMLLLPTICVFCYMVFGLVFGYLGDRRSRYVLLIVSIAIWWTGALLGTFCIYTYWLFFLCRLLVAVGQAGFSAIAPSVLADTVSGVRRTLTLAIFFAAIPAGAGMGYVVSAKLLQRTGQWWWGMRLTALLGALCTIGLSWIEEPARGAREAAKLGAQLPSERTVLWDDFIFLLTNGTYVLTTLGITAVSYVVGVLAWWLPRYVYDGLQIIEPHKQLTQVDVSTDLALMLVASGIGGAAIGAVLSGVLRPHFPNVDAAICSIGSLLAALLFAGTMLLSNENATATYSLIFCSFLALNTNWTVAGDILLYVVVHTNRCIATAMQMMVLHGLGGIIGPYIAAMTYENCRTECGFSPDAQDFHALRLALLTTFLAAVVASAFFLVATYFIEDDQDVAMKILLST